MENIMNSYLTGEDRLQAIQEAEYDATFHKLMTMYEMVDANLALNLEQAELKVFKESGTYEDLVYYYEEAEKEAAKKQGNIFTAIIGVITSILTSIGNTIAKIFGKGKADDTVTIPESAVTDHDNILAFWNNLSKGFNMIKSGNTGEGLVTFAKGLIIPTIAIGAGVAGAKMITKKRSDANKLASDVDGVRKNILNAIEAVKNVVGDGISIFFDKVKKFTDKIKTWVNDLFKKIAGASDDAQENSNGTTEEEPETKEQPKTEEQPKPEEKPETKNDTTTNTDEPHGVWHKKAKLFSWSNKDGEFKRPGGGVWKKKNEDGTWETMPDNYIPVGFSRKACVEVEASALVPILGELYVEKMQDYVDFYYGESADYQELEESTFDADAELESITNLLESM